MTVEVNREEAELLRVLVEERLRMLGPEIHHTVSRKFRDFLRHDQSVLESLHERLREPAPIM